MGTFHFFFRPFIFFRVFIFFEKIKNISRSKWQKKRCYLNKQSIFLWERAIATETIACERYAYPSTLFSYGETFSRLCTLDVPCGPYNNASLHRWGHDMPFSYPSSVKEMYQSTAYAHKDDYYTLHAVIGYLYDPRGTFEYTRRFTRRWRDRKRLAIWKETGWIYLAFPIVWMLLQLHASIKISIVCPFENRKIEGLK